MKEIITSDRPVQNIYWLAPDDTFWGKSLRFNSFVGALAQLKNKNNEELNLKCFMPLSNANDKATINNYRKIIPKDHQKYFFGIKEGLLEGNFEILVVENEFAVLILHVLDSESEYLTSFPIGSMCTNKSMVKNLVNLFEAWQGSENEEGIVFGPMFKK